jgi:8-hydroxy-5-deazaflavin:NADPH oxidoreductase
MNIGIIGAGNVGSSLGAAWAKAGHAIMYGARDPNSEKTRKALATVQDAKVGTIPEAVAFGEVILLAVSWSGAREAVVSLGDLNGNVLIDALNTFGPDPERGSGAEDIAAWATNARVVKAFNAMGANIMANPDFNGQSASTFIAGDDADAKATVTQLAQDIGLDVVDAGPLANAAYLEATAKLWVYLAHTAGMGRDIAFKLLRR